MDENGDYESDYRSDPLCDIATAIDSYITHFLDNPLCIAHAKAICSLQPLKPRWLLAISGRIERAVDQIRHPSASKVAPPHLLDAVAQIIHICAHASHGAFITVLEQTMSGIVAIIRRDPISATAHRSIDVLCVSAAAASTNEHSALQKSHRLWLFDNGIIVVMRAIRWCLEMLH